MSTVNRTARDEHEFQARLLVVENDVGQVKSMIVDLTKVVRESIAVHHNAPRAIPFKEIISSVGGTLAVVAIIMNFMNGWQELTTRDLSRQIARHEKQLEILAPLTYSIPKR